MADTHRVILTAESLSNLQAISDYICEQSPQNAAGIATAILDTIDSLAFMPARFKRVGKSRKHKTPVHAVVVKPFIIYYRVDDSPPAVYVTHIRHGGRRQPQRFQ